MNTELSEEFKNSLMQCKSEAVYTKWYKRYTDYKVEHNIDDNNNSIAIFVEYIQHLSNSMKVSTLWQAASCINKKLVITYNITHISNVFFKDFMKKLSKSYVPKKSAILSMDEINKYLVESEKTNNNLVVKVAALMGIYGALRSSEITYLNFEDIKQDNSGFIITIRKSKTDQAGIGSQFVIPTLPRSEICPSHHLACYIALFEEQKGMNTF